MKKRFDVQDRQPSGPGGLVPPNTIPPHPGLPLCDCGKPYFPGYVGATEPATMENYPNCVGGIYPFPVWSPSGCKPTIIQRSFDINEEKRCIELHDYSNCRSPGSSMPSYGSASYGGLPRNPHIHRCNVIVTVRTKDSKLMNLKILSRNFATNIPVCAMIQDRIYHEIRMELFKRHRIRPRPHRIRFKPCIFCTDKR